jgi:hypothetical protein
MGEVQAGGKQQRFAVILPSLTLFGFYFFLQEKRFARETLINKQAFN